MFIGRSCAVLLCLASSLAACGERPSQSSSRSAPGQQPAGAPPTKEVCQADTLAASQVADTWLSQKNADSTWLSVEEIANYNAAQLTPTSSEAKPLTQRALIEGLFAKSALGCAADDPSCVKVFAEVFGSFGLSAKETPLGSFSLNISSLRDEEERVRILEELREVGAVLLVTKGRSLVYLGIDASGAPVAFGGAEGCGAPGRLAAVKLRAGSPTLLSQITELRVLGTTIPSDLLGVSKSREAAEVKLPEGKACNTPDGSAIYYTPETPNSTQPLRLIIVSRGHPGPARLDIIDPDGKRITPKLRVLGGPPFSYVAELQSPKSGSWRAAFGDGSRVVSCRELKVQKAAPKGGSSELTNPFWRPTRSWSEETEIFYSAFVESLFSYPIKEDLTWKDLHSLLRDPQKNLLYNHFSRDEENKITVQPDCADLPVALRVYFAWKMSLPYGVRQCDRGKEGRPPVCKGGLVATNMMSRATPEELAPEEELPLEAPLKEKAKDPSVYKDNIKAFSRFATSAMVAMNSGAGRTAPDNSETDYYPIPLTREALRPGTVFADPYGHILIIVQWVPQTFEEYGILMGADAQPDGTVGRRRFWQGSFLFVSNTNDVGAGFKAFRPAFKSGSGLSASVNSRLSASKEFVPFSKEQYAGTTDDFYDKMDALINPRPLDPTDKMRSLIASLEEAVSRRVLAVQNGEDYIKEHPGEISMPKGYAIFETSGPWEDFATPSRDMRLLISIDTVEDFVASVKRRPERFGLKAGPALEAALTKLSSELSAELSTRTFEYKRQDGSPWRLTLQGVLDRQGSLEAGYNPNDCPEARWGAAVGSDEYKTCTRRAPAAQVKLLKEYQPWFSTRTRPPRR